MKKGVLLLSTGGTISSVRKGEGGTVVPTLSGQELVATLPGIEKVAVVDAKEFSKVPGHYLGFQEMLDLSGRMEDALSSRDYSGVVVFFFQAEDGIRYLTVTGVQTCALPI